MANWKARFARGSRIRRVKIKQHDIADCAAACLASVLAWYRRDVPIARIRQYASTDQKGTTAWGIIQAAKKLNLSAKGVRGDLVALPDIPLPAIAHVVVRQRLQHYVVVYGVSKSHVQLMDPATGTMDKIPLPTFMESWTGVLILLSPDDGFRPGSEKASVASRFLYLLKPHKAILWQVLTGALLFTVLGLSTSIFLQKIVDHVIPDGNRNLLNLMGLAMVAILVVKLIINHARTILTINTGQQIDARLILGYYKHLLRLPQAFFDNMRVGEIISRMNDAVKIRAFVNDVLVGLAVNVFIVLFSFALMFSYYWKLALVLVLVVPLFSIIYYFANRLHRKTQRKLMEDSADLEAQLVESVNAARTIKRFGLEEFANLKTETRFIQLLKSVYTSATNSLWIGNANGLVAGLFTVILLWLGTLFVLNKTITPGELLSFYAILGYFIGPVGSLIGMNKTIQDAVIAADRLFEVMDLEREETENQSDLTPEMIGDMAFVDVKFQYGTRTTVFEKLNLRIAKGKITAIVGESGSGKTTLLSLLHNMYPIQGGKIVMGDFDVRYLTHDSLRRLVGVVPQEVHLFAGNIVQNIAIGDLSPDMNEIMKLCKELDMLSFIEQLPAGFNTYIGENGAQLSGGQRQRIAIARSLYRRPEVLILDEATSSLDSISESHVRQAIADFNKQGKTVILIAHRLSTVMNADRIVVLHKGRLVEEGHHSSLMNIKGYYYNMWQQQFPPEFALLGKPLPGN
ncbi:MAG TPA: peptidase domain-containing ABC transporter [Parapedobacter sp.]|uniref:peptidase domain-containing ABC transporter n=1 Tax=Parapedobacter sp. TaxID=1958893 RepID=UPI002BC96666|nr:peptidase domain-containing ABC transporter [Parapedobacter sp.]HWK58161.1 peptidase domain-containing ABC transporter [Parapedobacter sp.]